MPIPDRGGTGSVALPMAERERALILELRKPTPASHQEMVVREDAHEALEIALIVATSDARRLYLPDTRSEDGRDEQ